MVAIASVHGVLAPHRFTRHELTPRNWVLADVAWAPPDRPVGALPDVLSS